MHTVFALLCFVVVIHWLIFPYPSGVLHWHCGNLTIAPVPAKQPWWIWINTSCEFIMNDCITTTKQSTTKPCAYFLGYTVYLLKCTHSLFVPCFVVVIASFHLDSCDILTHIVQGCFIGIATYDCPSAREVTLNSMGEVDLGYTPTKHNKMWTMWVMLGM